ncbi:MAG: sporulation initiation factor Spo0A C-terminal domain-containing protein [Clostridia bacterium]|nr:sporulation initiation factor Spo0A C-terminal domain-containing protein [Clostridia bacterium]
MRKTNLRGRDFSESDRRTVKFISSFLTDIGVPRHYSGHVYFTYALFLVKENPDSLHHVTKEVYPVVADKFGISPLNVERNMRNALEAAWRKNDILRYPELFISSYLKTDARPSNTEFMNAVMEMIDFMDEGKRL